MGIPRAMVPGSVDGFRRYFAEVRPRLCVSAEAARTIAFVVRPNLANDISLDLRLAARVFGPMAAMLVPRDLRELARLPARGARELPARAMNNITWRVVPHLGQVPVLDALLDRWAVRLVGETPVKLALHHQRSAREV
jgi:uncharacterized protein (DUF2236 family)